MRITGGRLITAEGQEFENGYVDFENGVITAFGDAAEQALGGRRGVRGRCGHGSAFGRSGKGAGGRPPAPGRQR